MIKMILAVDQNNKIGHTDGRLPWNIPADMKRFKQLTTGWPCLMGGNTFRSLNRPHGLPNRHNAVLSRGAIEPWVSDDGWASLIGITDIEEFISMQPGQNIWVIGGAQIYDFMLDELLVDQIHLTRVHQSTDALVGIADDLYNVDVFIADQLHRFGAIWQIIEEENHDGFQFVTLEKVYYEN